MFKDLSSILTVRGASYHIKGKNEDMQSMCPDHVNLWETWAMKAENLQSLDRAERMMVRWMCGVSAEGTVWICSVF